jgi:predicted ribosomally synthesized peptide with SipW-like signal peptide
MENSKSTKRALITSALAILMCVAMLIGTTFAWFTDTASTGVNKIQAGNLDVELEYKNSDTTGFTKADKNTKVFKEGALWEPGHVEYVVLKVSNAGSLALKYKLGINIANEVGSTNVYNKEFKLSDYIRFAVLDGDKTEGSVDRDALVAAATDSKLIKEGYTAENHLMATGTDNSQKVVTLVVWMPTTVGNEANHKKDATAPSIDLGISVVATQDTVESDSFGTQYDKDATYPVIVSNQQQANDAITNATDKKVNISIASDQTITLDNGIANEGDKSRDITFSGNGSQTVDVVTNAVNAEGGQLNYQRGSSFTFENLTIQAGEGNFDGIVCNELTFKDCTIKGKLTLFGKATFINCVFDNTMANQYSIWTWGGTDVTFENCTFNTNGKAILLYGGADGKNPTNLVVNNCIFNDRNSGAAGKAAIEIGNDYNATYTLTVNNATVNGFADGKNTGSKLWANKNSMDAEHLTVTIDGNKVQ